MSGDRTKGRTPIYPASLKVAVAREYLTSGLSYKGLAEKYGIDKAGTIRSFVRWYKRKYPAGLTGPPESGSDEMPVSAEKDLKQANLRIAALEMLIENASKELQVDLVKKFGTKQLKK